MKKLSLGAYVNYEITNWGLLNIDSIAFSGEFYQSSNQIYTISWAEYIGSSERGYGQYFVFKDKILIASEKIMRPEYGKITDNVYPKLNRTKV